MKIKAFLATAAAAVMLAGCSSDVSDYPKVTVDSSSSENSSFVEKTELSYGTGLQENYITAKKEQDQKRQITRRRTTDKKKRKEKEKNKRIKKK